MLFTIIIPTCNRNDLLSLCLKKLDSSVQDISFDEYEVIVTDDSKDNRAKLLINEEYKWAKWVSGPKQGPAANRNNGAKYANGEWLIFIDDDCLPGANILNEYKKAIKDNISCLAFEGAILPDNWELLKKDMAECPTNVDGGCFWSANICINKYLFFKIKGFDEDFKIAAQEDQLIYHNIRKENVVIFISTATVTHPVRFISLRNKIKNNKASLRNWFVYTQKIGTKPYKAFTNGFISQFKDMKVNLISYKPQKTLLNIYILFIGLPILILHYVKNKSK
ncbi:glycosyltransferase family 2 protein [Chitinophagaceae bacterium LWZ2-11]